jgi:tetratricopeptide (TPR) repeat protein
MLGTAIVELTNVDEADVYMDEQLVGKVTSGKPLVLPRLTSGLHVFKGVREGYQPDVKEVLVAPGQEVTVTLRIRYRREIKKSALELNERGERLLSNQLSSTLDVVGIASGSQTEAELRQAKVFFERALEDDPAFARPAYRLGMVEQLLGDFDASIGAYRLALTIDPGDVDARVNLAGVIIETGDADLAIRELTEAARLDAKDDRVYSMLALAYWAKGAWREAITEADRALALNASNAQAHLWRADSGRQLALAEPAGDGRSRLFVEARDHYRQFIELTNFESSTMRKILFFTTGLVERKHADRQQSFDRLRVSAFLGLCITERNVGLLHKARTYCQRALKYDDAQPMTHYQLGAVSLELFNAENSCEHLASAASHYATMLKVNPDLQEAKTARAYLEQITASSRQLRCKTG